MEIVWTGLSFVLFSCGGGGASLFFIFFFLSSDGEVISLIGMYIVFSGLFLAGGKWIPCADCSV